MLPRHPQQIADTPSPKSGSTCITDILSRPPLNPGALPSIPRKSGNQDTAGLSSYNAPTSDVGFRCLHYLPPDGNTNQHRDYRQVSQLADEIDFSHPSPSEVHTPSALARPLLVNIAMASQRKIETQSTSNRSHGSLDPLSEVLNTAQSEPDFSAINLPASPDIETTMIENNEGYTTTEHLQPSRREIAREQSSLPSKYPCRSTKHTKIELQNQGPQETRMEGTPLLEHRMQGDEDWCKSTEYDH